MKDKDKTQKQLITELSKLRRRIAELEGCERQRKEIEETLTRWNQQKTAILDSMSELVAYQDTRMRILWANRAAGESVGVDPQQLVGRHCYEIWQQRHRPCVGCPVIKARKSGHPHEAEITTSDGRMWLIRGYPVRNTKGNVTGAVEVTLEITDRKQAEEKIKHLNLALHAIRNVNQLITREKDRDKLLKGTCKNLVENRGYHSTWIALLDEAGGLVTTAEAGLDKSFTPLIEQLKRSVMTRCGHKALSQAGVVVTENPFSNCTDCPLSDKYHDRSAMTVRLEYGGKVRGLLSASIPVYLAADEEEQALFREVAEDISFALHNIEVEKDRGRAEEALQESEERYKMLFDEAVVGISLADAETEIIINCNQALAALVGRKRAELIGKPQNILHPPSGDDKKVFSPTFKRHLTDKEGQILETQVITKTGDIKEVEIKANILDIQGRKVLQGFFRDITERKRAEEGLRESETRFRTLFEGIPDSILVHDDEGTILHINEVGAQQLEWIPKDLVGRNLREIVTPENATSIADHVKEVHKVGWCRFETTYVSRSGWQIAAEVNEHPIKFGKKKAILSVAHDITERKEAEKTLLREKIFSDVVINSSPGLFFVISDKGNAIQWNKKAEMVTGYSASEISKMNILAFVATDDKKTAAEAIQEAFTNGQASIEINVLAKSGKKIPFHIKGRRAKIENITCVICAGMDITARKQAEKELRESEERFRTFADEVTFEGLIIHDKGKIRDVNRQFAEMHGYEISELLEIDALAPVAPESRDLILKHIQKGYEKPYEAVALRKDGSRFPMEIRAKKIPYHGKMVRATAIRDITERKRMEEDLRESKEKYRDLVETINDWIWEVDQNGLFTYISPRITDLLGYEPEEWLGKTPFDFMPPEETRRVRGLFDQLVANHQPVVNLENTVLHKDGRLVVFETSAVPFFDPGPGGEFKGYRGVNRNITDRKKAEEKLQKSYKQLQSTFITTVNALASTVEMKDQYTAGHQPRVSHLASAIAKEMGLPEEQIKSIRMAGLIHDIGKIIVPAEILNKPGPLTDIQYEMVKMHPRAGFDILKGIKFPWPVAQIIFQHHELMDGSGYPQGLAGDQIMLEARVLTVANVVEAMTSHRPYRAAHDITAALNEIKKHKGMLYDPGVVDACLRLFKEKGFTLDSLLEPAPPPVAS
jgi:PAS domain S-box-containing protein/putative nucleotidyltransferase with HDIG domain